MHVTATFADGGGVARARENSYRPEQALRVRCRDLRDPCFLFAAQLRHGAQHLDQPGRLVALAAMVRGGLVRRVGLEQQVLERHLAHQGTEDGWRARR
jgi:hypothetical protein